MFPFNLNVFNTDKLRQDFENLEISPRKVSSFSVSIIISIGLNYTYIIGLNYMILVRIVSASTKHSLTINFFIISI